MDRKYRMKFEYDKRGYGYLELWCQAVMINKWYARSGSCDKTGKLVNAINPHIWYIIDGPVPPHKSEYDKMYVKKKQGKGWKIRLWPIPTPKEHDPTSHYLIHPDGNKPGTSGCIGIQKSNAVDLHNWLIKHYTEKSNDIIPVEISIKQPKIESEEKPVAKLIKKKTTAKVTTVMILSTIVAHGICNVAPAVPEFLGSIGFDGKLVLASAATGLIVWLRDLVKHKFGLNLPFLHDQF